MGTLPSRWLLLVSIFLSTGCSADPIASRYVQTASFGADSTMPSLLADPSGTLHAAYIQGDNLYYTRSIDGGKNFATPLRVNERTGFVAGGLFRGPELALSRDGLLWIAWTNRAWQLGLPRDEYGLMYSRVRGLRREGADVNLTHGPIDGYSVAASVAGVRFSWHTGDAVFLARQQDADGSVQATALPNLLPCECCDTALSVRNDGSVTVVYRDRVDNRRNMYRVKISSDGAVRGRLKLDHEDWIIEGCPVSGVALLQMDGADVIAWERDGRILLVKLPDGAAEAPLPVDIGSGKYPVLAQSGDKVLVAYSARKNVVWSVRDTNTMAIVADGREPARISARPAAAGLGDGRFLVIP